MTDTVVFAIYQVLFDSLTSFNPLICSYNVNTIIMLVLLLLCYSVHFMEARKVK